MGIDPMADDAGQQTMSPYHAMACNPSTMVDPLGLAPKGEAHNGNPVYNPLMEVFLRFPTLAYHLNGIANYGEVSGNKMLENQELQRLIEKNVNTYLATVGGEGARYYGGAGSGNVSKIPG